MLYNASNMQSIHPCNVLVTPLYKRLRSNALLHLLPSLLVALLLPPFSMTLPLLPLVNLGKGSPRILLCSSSNVLTSDGGRVLLHKNLGCRLLPLPCPSLPCSFPPPLTFFPFPPPCTTSP
jgi:hypothetical protein